MDNWITPYLEQYGYLSVFLLIMLENVFPPIPSELILGFGGFMTTYTSMSKTGVIIFATFGSIAGAIILYGVGRLLDVKRLEKIVNRYGNILRIKTNDIKKADLWFKKYGTFTVFFCRMIPLVRSLISIPAGISNMNFSLFLLYTTLGTLIWNVILVWSGAMLGSSWSKILQFKNIYSNITYVIIALVIVGFILWYVKMKNKN